MVPCCARQYFQQQQIFLKIQRIGNCQSTLLMVFTQGYLKLLADLIIHLDASIPCLSPTVYKYIESGSISPQFCSIDDVVDVELKELIEKVHT